MLVMISNIIAIYRKELQSYFASPFAYAIAAVFWLITGYFLIAILLAPDGLIPQIAQRDQNGNHRTTHRRSLRIFATLPANYGFSFTYSYYPHFQWDFTPKNASEAL